MPTEQPSNAPDKVKPEAGEDSTAAAVLSHEQLDDAPGGGGLGGAAATGGIGGIAGGQGGTVPNSPIDTGVSGELGGGDASAKEAREAARLAVDAGGESGHRSSV